VATLHLFQITSLEQHGPLLIAAVCREAGHRVLLSVVQSPAQVAAEVARSGADVAGFSATTGAHKGCLAAAREVKRRTRALTILGGPHATACPEVVEQDGLDMVCRGEGEEATLELLEQLDGRRPEGPVANLLRAGEDPREMTLRPPLEDLDRLPYPARDLLPTAGPALRHFLSARGCPYACAYCLSPTTHRLFGGAAVRQRGVEHVVGELQQVQQNHRLRHVLLADDIFGLDKAWAARFLPAYRASVGLPFSCHLRVGTFDATFLQALKGAGCRLVSFGLEAGSDRVRRQIMNRPISDDQILEAARLVRGAGMAMEVTCMVGLPTETLDEAMSTVALCRRCSPDMVSVSIFQPYPGADLTSLALERGLISEGYQDQIAPTYYQSSPLIQPDIGPLVNLHKLFALAVQFPSLEGVIRKLVELPSNPAFTAAFLATYGARSARLYLPSGQALLDLSLAWARRVLKP